MVVRAAAQRGGAEPASSSSPALDCAEGSVSTLLDLAMVAAFQEQHHSLDLSPVSCFKRLLAQSQKLEQETFVGRGCRDATCRFGVEQVGAGTTFSCPRHFRALPGWRVSYFATPR